jgi:hypothetical protein
MTDTWMSEATSAPAERSGPSWLRTHAGFFVPVGLIAVVVVENTVLQSSFYASATRYLTIGALVMAPFLIAALLLAESTAGRRSAAALLFTAAVGATVLTGSPQFEFGRQLAGIPWLAAAILGFTGWLILARRAPAAFVLLIPLAVIGYLWHINHWVIAHEDTWLHTAGVPYPSSDHGSVLWIVYGAWANLDLFVATALAWFAGLAAKNRRQPAADPYRQAYASSGGQYSFGAPIATPSTNRTAITSLICGVVGMFLFFPAAIPAVICGHTARRQIRQTGAGGSGLALAGLIMGYLGLLILIGLVVAVVAVVSSAGGSTS